MIGLTHGIWEDVQVAGGTALPVAEQVRGNGFGDR
jgi:hypothetical protein